MANQYDHNSVTYTEDAGFGGVHPTGDMAKGALAFVIAVAVATSIPHIFHSTAPFIVDYLGFDTTRAIQGGRLWQFFTAPFFHLSCANIAFVLVDLVALYFLSIFVGRLWRPWRYWTYVAVCSIAAYLGIWAAANLMGEPVVAFGPTGILLGLLLALGFEYGDTKIMVLGMVPMTGRQFSVLMGILFTLAILVGMGRIYLSYLAAALAGWLYLAWARSRYRRLWTTKTAEPPGRFTEL